MARDAVACGAVALLLLLAVLAAWCAPAPPPAPGAAGCPLRGGSCHQVPLLLSENTGGEGSVAIPLHYHLGVFEMDLWLGDQPLRAVFDTGSERLIVASDECVGRHMCNQESGVYHVPAGAKILHESIISYGTQQDSVRWLRDTLALPNAGDVPCHKLYDTPGPTTRALRRALEVGAVYHRTGQSNLNVLGFSQTYPGQEPSAASVLPALCGARAHFALILFDAHGWLILHPSPLRPCFDSFRVPLVRLPSIKYYAVEVTGVRVVDPATGAARACRHAPRYAIIDSGSNMMSVSSALLAELEGAGVRAGAGAHGGAGGRLELALAATTAAPRAGGTLSYTPAQYAMGHQLLIRDNLPMDTEDAPQFLILGSLFLRHLYVEVDVDAQTVLFGRQLCHNAPCRPSPAVPPPHADETPPPICVRRR